MTTRGQLRGALTNVLSNASNFPERVQTRILGQDMGPLTEKATDAALAVFAHAHTATDDEREAIIAALLDELGWEWDDVPEEHIPSSRTILGDMAGRVLAVSAGFRRTVQGEPTAEVPDPHGRGMVCAACGVPFRLVQHDEGCDRRKPQGESTPVRFVARQVGKAQSTIDALLAQANEYGIRVEVVYPQGEPTDAIPLWERPEAIEAARLAYQGAYEADYDAEDCIASALRAAAATQEGENRG